MNVIKPYASCILCPPLRAFGIIGLLQQGRMSASQGQGFALFIFLLFLFCLILCHPASLSPTQFSTQKHSTLTPAPGLACSRHLIISVEWKRKVISSRGNILSFRGDVRWFQFAKDRIYGCLYLFDNSKEKCPSRKMIFK